MEPRLPEEIYKSHLEEKRGAAHKENLDSAKENLASTFVNGFVDAPFFLRNKTRMAPPRGGV